MDTRLAHAGATPDAPLICVIDSHEHPFALEHAAQKLHCAVASVYVDDWNHALAPWIAPGLYNEEDSFGDGAAATLSNLLDEQIPTLVRNEGLAPSAFGIAGYSLGGLFSLYAFCSSDAFVAAASVSGSLWYDDWLAFVDRAQVDNANERYAYLSVGTKEKRAAKRRLKQVEQCTHQTEELLARKGVRTELVLGPGGHLAHVEQRLTRALTALDGWLVKRQAAH